MVSASSTSTNLAGPAGGKGKGPHSHSHGHNDKCGGCFRDILYFYLNNIIFFAFELKCI